MSTSEQLLETTAQDVLRMLSHREYSDAVEEMFSLSSAAAIYVTAVVMEGLNPKVQRRFVEAAKGWLDLRDAADRAAKMREGEGAPRHR